MRSSPGFSSPLCSRPTAIAWRLLPLTILGALVALGLAIEAVWHDTLLWQSKLPVALALAFAFARACRAPA